MVHKEVINVICIGVLSACIYVHHIYAVPMEPDKESGTLELEFNGCERPFGFRDLFMCNKCS